MYSDLFCKIYNEFGWNYFPEAFGEQLLIWFGQNAFFPKTALDIGCGTGVLCDILEKKGISCTGIDLSEGMIEIAKKEHPGSEFEVANMITYAPEKKFDLVTCTGDALNHVLDLSDVKRVFEHVYGYLNPGGYFIFDILNEKETGDGEPIDLEYSEDIKAVFQIAKDEDKMVTLSVTVFEKGEQMVKEEIHEIVHDPDYICNMLAGTGFKSVKRNNRLLDNEKNKSTTWYVIAQK